MGDLKKSLEVAIAKSEYKNMADMCRQNNMSASSFAPMRKNSESLRWSSVVRAAEIFNVPVSEFIRWGE